MIFSLLLVKFVLTFPVGYLYVE